ncbi:MAG: hypothetical protein L3J39_19620 [Verrucomicrobiales bacterium]|nr:hypothetical protein [Verrucomicrobiales bacterium]
MALINTDANKVDLLKCFFMNQGWLGLCFLLYSCDSKSVPEEDISKVQSFLIAFELDGYLPDPSSGEWEEYEFWINSYGKKRFMRTLPMIKSRRADLKDECLFFEEYYSVKHNKVPQ